MQLDISSDSEEEENYENENSRINAFTLWKNVTHNDQHLQKINFSTEFKIPGPNERVHYTKPIEFFRLFFTDTVLETILHIVCCCFFNEN